MPIVDTLTTRFLYDTSGVSKGRQEVLGATRAIGQEIGRSISNVARQGVAFGAVLGGSLLAIGKSATDQAISFDTLSRSLTAVTKSGQRAKEVLNFADDLALPSIFESKVLADAALQLEAFGLKTERFLPVAEKLGTIFGGNTESLMQFVRALGFIKGKRFGEGFEALASAGISREDLSNGFGLQFSKSGEFQGDVEQALTAVEAIVKQRFGRLSEELASSPAAAIASLGDVGSRILRSTGDSILKVMVPALNLVSGRLSEIARSGAIKDVTDELAALFSGKDIGRFLVDGVDALLVVFKQLPGWLEKNRESFKGIFESAKSLGATLSTSALPMLDRMLGVAEKLLGVFTALPGSIQSLLGTLFLVNKATGGLVSGLAGAAGGIKVGADGGTLGSLLGKAILGPIGLIGSVLIAGAVGLASSASKAIDVLEGRKEDRAAVADFVYPTDPQTGKRIVDPATGKYLPRRARTPEEKEAEYQRLRRERKKRDIKRTLGIDVDEQEAAISGLTGAVPGAENAPGSPGAAPVYDTVLERIATAVETTADLNKQSMGGGALSRDAVQARNLSGLGRQGFFQRRMATFGGQMDAFVDGIVNRHNSRMRQHGM